MINFARWRELAREGIASRVRPEHMRWHEELELFAQPLLLQASPASFSCPKEFFELARRVSLHRNLDKWDLLYRMLWEIVCEQRRHLLQDAADPLTRKASVYAKQVGRDMHKMTAFVRFEKFREDPEAFVAWYEPDHDILRATANFFVKRFGSMNWSILSPGGGLAWNQQELAWLEGPLQKPQNLNDPQEELWKTYFCSIFNPARLKVAMMKREMPVRYWKNLPEAELIPELIQGASKRMQDMIQASQVEVRERPRDAGALPMANDVETLREQIKTCAACDLCQTQRPAVPSAGPTKAKVMIVGEQPGDEEDKQGVPFVGPAGKLLRDMLKDVGIDESDIYFTNSVKHFRFVISGKRRLHKRPDVKHIKACRPWLEQETSLVKPNLIICMGATAIHGVLGYALNVKHAREDKTLRHACGAQVRVTYHPAAILRADDDRRQELLEAMRDDLQQAQREFIPPMAV